LRFFINLVYTVYIVYTVLTSTLIETNDRFIYIGVCTLKWYENDTLMYINPVNKSKITKRTFYSQGESDNPSTSIYAAEEILKSLSITEGLIRKVLTASAKVIDATDDDFDGTTFKVKGLVYENLNNDRGALIAFDTALKVNPKVGVKQKADSIRKRLNKS